MTDGQFQLSPSQIAERRKAMDADVWLFIKWVCGHGERAVERFHRPLAYLYKADAARLAACLDRYESEIVRQIRAVCVAKGINWRTRAGVKALKRLLRRVNCRISRSMAKTTIGLDVLAQEASEDPNINIGIFSKSDPASETMCETIGNIMRTEEYAVFYPDRLFYRANGTPDYDSYITRSWIRLNGRTTANQDTIEARGCNSQSYSRHYHKIYCDDLSSTEAKQGVATLEDALRFIASINGISMPSWGETRELFNGTITSNKDDNAVLARDPDVLSICVPIWKKNVPSTLSNVLKDGEPVLPEWYPLAECRRKRDREINNPQFGPISWLQNFELSAADLGSMHFTIDLLTRAHFEWVLKVVDGGLGKVERRFMRRYLWNGDGSPKRDSKRELAILPCTCWMKCSYRDHAFVEYDPLSLPRSIGVDQSLSLTGDKWAVRPACIDPEGFVYALKGRTGRGYRSMIPAIPLVYHQIGGTLNPPQKVGIESNAWQGVTSDWMKRDESFRYLARRIERVSPGRTAKEVRIFNDVLSNMEMGTLLTDPDDHEADQEMLSYNAAEEDPEDNILDATGIAITILKKPAYVNEYDDDVRRRRRASDSDSGVDALTGVDVSTDFLEESFSGGGMSMFE